MFRRFSLSLPRVFRLRRRRSRGTKANASTRTARRSTLEASPSPSGSSHLVPSPPESTHVPPITTRRRSFFTHSPLSPIPQSPITPTRDAPTPILIIGHDPAQPTHPPPTMPADVGSQPHADRALSLEPQPAPTHPNTRRVSFQLPTTHTEDLELPESPLSTTSTLVPDVESQVQTQGEIGPVVPVEQVTAEARDTGSVPVGSAELDVGLDGVVPCELGRTRPASLLISQPVRVDVSRFSMPATPIVATNTTTTTNTTTREGKRENKRISLMSLISRSGTGLGSTKKEKRTSKWSRELNKPETQEVLRALSEL